jgi:hypothetical protein
MLQIQKFAIAILLLLLKVITNQKPNIIKDIIKSQISIKYN